MPTVDKYVNMAEEAQEDNAHVAVLIYYISAIEEKGYDSNAAPVLLAALQYAQRLKKEKDRKAIADWGLRAIEKMKTTLEETIDQEIKKLQMGVNENATT